MKKGDRTQPVSGQASEDAVSRPADWMFLQPSILDQMHDAIIVTDLEGRVTGCNRAAFHMYGYSAEELIGKSVEILYPEENRHLLTQKVVPTVLATGEYRGEQQNRTRSGDTIYIHLSISVLRDRGWEAGRIGGIFGQYNATEAG